MQAVVHQVRLFVQHSNEQQGKRTGLQQLCWTIGFIGVFGKFCIIPGCLLSWRAVGTLAFLLAIVSRVKDTRVFTMLLFFLGVTTLTSLNVPEVATPTGGVVPVSKGAKENRYSPVFNADFPVAEKYVSVPDNVIEQFENSKLQCYSADMEDGGTKDANKHQVVEISPDTGANINITNSIQNLNTDFPIYKRSNSVSGVGGG